MPENSNIWRNKLFIGINEVEYGIEVQTNNSFYRPSTPKYNFVQLD